VLLGQVTQDCFIGVRTVSHHLGVDEATKGVSVPGLDRLKPRLLHQKAKTSMVETHQGTSAGELRLHGLKVVFDAWAAIAMAWATPYR
jgi:hypothetical protein